MIIFIIFASRFLVYNNMTYRELIYIIRDRLKLSSDDTYFTDEHFLFLISKYRAYMLKQSYKDVKKTIPQSNYQEICIDLQLQKSDNPCGDDYLVSKQEIPDYIEIYPPIINTIDGFSGGNIVFVTSDRFKYVGSNRYMRNIIYACIYDKHIYLKSNNIQFMYLKKLRLKAIFEDIELASELTCDESKICELYDMKFPMEDAMVPQLVDGIFTMISNSKYSPEDTQNNANDDLSTLANYIRNNTKSDLQKQI